jgi:molybdopterin converting factor small subunit
MEKYPDLSGRILPEKGAIRRLVNIFINDGVFNFLQEAKTQVEKSDVISSVPALAGG